MGHHRRVDRPTTGGAGGGTTRSSRGGSLDRLADRATALAQCRKAADAEAEAETTRAVAAPSAQRPQDAPERVILAVPPPPAAPAPQSAVGAIAVMARIWWPEITVAYVATGRVVTVARGGAGAGGNPMVTTTVRDLPPGTYRVTVRATSRASVDAEAETRVVAGLTTALDLSKSASTADDLAGRGNQGPDRGGPVL